MAADGKGLMALVRAKPEAFTSFVEQYQPLVYRWSVGLLYDRDEAEDVMQEVFILAYRKMGSFRDEVPSKAGCTESQVALPANTVCGKRGARGSVNRPRRAVARSVYDRSGRKSGS